MKISNWGIIRGCGATSNLAAISIMGVLEHQHRITLVENHCREQDIGSKILFYAKSEIVKEDNLYYLGYGVSDCLIREISKTTNKRIADYDRLEIIENKLFYIPQRDAPSEAFELCFQHDLVPIIKTISEMEELVFVNTECNHNSSSVEILNEAELVIVNLKQDTLCVYDFFAKYSSLIDKAIFIISNYRRKRDEKVLKLLKDFGVSKERIGVILHNDEFQVAMEQGRSVEFITSHYRCGRDNSNYQFIKALKKATKLVMNCIDEINNKSIKDQ